jgi:hypothetical protein
VSWAKLWAKAKENSARNKRIVRRGNGFMIFFIIGAICTLAAGLDLYSVVRHQILGRPATATLMERIKQCTVEYQLIGDEKRKEQWPCEQAEEFHRRAGWNKVKLSHDYIARVQFPLEDGRTHEANVDEKKLYPHKLAIGATLPVTYVPDDPADVRAKMSWETLSVPLGLLAIGIPFLALALGVSLPALLGAFRGRGEETVPVTSEHIAPAATQVPGRMDSNKVARNLAAQTAVDAYSRTTGSAPRAPFGIRNK